MRILLITTLSIILLSSCTLLPKKDTALSPYPSIPLGVSTELSLPAQAPSGGSYTAKGTEPFWAVTVNPGNAKFSRPGENGVNEISFNTIEDNKGSIVTIKSVKGDFFLNMVKGSCSDGMSETKYEYTATTLIGAESLTGCAMKIQ